MSTTSQPPAPADTAERKPRITAPRVFWPAATLLVVFVAIAAIFSDWLGDVLTTANNTVVTEIGWYYILLVSGFVFFALWLAITPMGAIVLGKDDEKPDFDLKSWFAMLFAAGMGIGLVFWGVAEPLSHYAAPPPGVDGSDAAVASAAMDQTFLHWGLHAWAIYVIVGLAVAYSVHRKGRPVSIRWALEPVLGDRVNSWWGDAIDVIAIIGTLFGVATSLGFGVTQIGAGFSFLGWVEEPSNLLLVVLIAIITGVAVTSCITGVDKGIKWLSNVNMLLAAGLVLLVLVLGPTVFLLSNFTQQIGSYLENFLRLSFNTLSFQDQAGQDWLSGWTTYYWGWWISWAPFVGVFIARISKGRTVREFVAGVLLVPTVVTFLWFSIMGGSALHTELFGGGGLIADGAVSTDNALFQLFEGMPASTLLSVIAIFLVVVFFVTSSDSGSFVVDMIASGGNPQPPVWSRAFWATLEGVIAAVLLLAGGLAALQTMAILVAVPFSIVMVLMVASIAKALVGEQREYERQQRMLLRDQLTDHVKEHVTEHVTDLTDERFEEFERSFAEQETNGRRSRSKT